MLLTGGTLAAACTDIPTSPDEPFSIEFSGLPFPAVIAGDTLRGPEGSIAPLTATVYNLSGMPITGAEVEFLVPSPGATLLDGNFLHGDSTVGKSGAVAIYARAGGLQSLPETVYVVPAGPDTLIRVAEERLELTYDVLPEPDISGELEVRVARPDLVGGDGQKGVEHWPVYFTLVARGDTIAPQDTSLVWLIQGNSMTPATADTTDATGRASTRVRVNAFSPDIDGLDSVVVYVSTPRFGAATGPPALTTRFTILLRAR